MIKYRVGTLREAGLEARWSRTRIGAPILFARDPQSNDKTWWVVDRGMWKEMQQYGVREGFESMTILGDIFSVEA